MIVVAINLPRWAEVTVFAVILLAGLLIVVTLQEKLMHAVSKRRIHRKFKNILANPGRTIDG